MKLGIISDFACHTGFATVMHNIVRHLADDIDIKILAINFNGIPNKFTKEFGRAEIWPASIGGDQHGIKLINQWMEETKPDVILILQDPVIISRYMVYIQKIPVIAYYPVDAPNIKEEYILSLALCRDHVCYTSFGIAESVASAKRLLTMASNSWDENKGPLEQISLRLSDRDDVIDVDIARIEKMCNPAFYYKIGHGVEINFKTIQKAIAKSMFGINPNHFVVGNVNTNTARKRLDLTLEAFAMAASKNNDMRLLLYCQRGAGSIDLEQYALYLGIGDKVVFLHNQFKNISTTKLGFIYQAMDLQVNTSGGEGWGLTSMEGAKCGTIQLVPDYSATKEIWPWHLRIPLSGKVCVPGINTIQCAIDANCLSYMIGEFYKNRNSETFKEAQRECMDIANMPAYSWIGIGHDWNQIINQYR
jgi:D-inositol-3-phosphate glycosyltransferase